MKHSLQQEIASRARAEALLREANDKLEMVLESITDNFFALDHEWRFTYLNRHAAEQMKVLGKDPAALIGKVLWDEFPHVPNETALRRVMSERVPVTDELFYAPLGEWVENHLYPSRDGGLVGLQTYVTARKRADERLRRSELLLAEAQKLSHTGSWANNLRTHKVFWSDEAFRIRGFAPGQVEPSFALVLSGTHPDDRRLLEDSFLKALEKRSPYMLDCRIVRPNGEIRYTRNVALPAFDESGEVVEYVGTIIDLTERVQADAELRRTREALAHVTRVMTIGELAASVAHELSQPLTAVVANGAAGLRWLSRREPDVDEARRAIECIIRDAERAAQVVRWIRGFVRHDALAKAPLRLGEVIGVVVDMVESEAQSHRVAIRRRSVEGLPPVDADRVQLQQVVLNLAMNAIEAMHLISDRPRVLQIQEDRYGSEQVMVSVSDSGPGYAEEYAERLFDAFYTTKPGGLGMGLAVSRSIVEAHGGRLWASQKRGEGATFHFALPVRA